MNSREKIAHDYLIFRYPTEYLLLIFPVLIGLLVNILISNNITTNNIPSEADIQQFQSQAILNYLITSKITITILIAFFICYRWANMLNDGSYGFWLTTGVIRRVFFLRTLVKFIGLLFIAQLIGIFVVIYLNTIYLEFLAIIRLILSILSHLILLVTLAIFFSNQFRNPELASISFLTIMGFNLGFNRDTSSIFYLFLQNDLAYNNDSAFLAIGTTLLGSLVLMVFALRIHLTQDINI